jgi:hypothetical protein
MRSRRPATLAVITIATLSGLSAGSAGADSRDIGSTAGLSNQALDCGAGTTFFQGTTGSPPGYAAASGGVVTSFTVMAGPASEGQVELRTAHEGPTNTFTITGASEAHALVPGRLNSFLTRIAIRAGDVVALHLPAENLSVPCNYVSGDAGDVVRFRAGTFDDPVGTVVATGGAAPGVRLDLSARVEPDADGDGYGDLTQDACPTLPNSHDDCTPPDSFLKSGPTKKVHATKKKTKVTISFFASEPSTSTCAVDKAAAVPCSSPFKAKVTSGKHAVTVRATDSVGNVDPTPLVVRFTVTRVVG